MIRLENMLPTAFLMGIIEMVDSVGPEKTYYWLQSIGKRLGELEGAGFEGARDDSINYLPVCPFGTDLIDFININGERPQQYMDLIDFSNKKRDISDKPWEYPALTNVLGILHHSYSKQRADMAGVKLLNVGSRSPLTDAIEYNDAAIERAGLSREEVDHYLERSFCVFKIADSGTE
ncbi:MAG: hypothetical protein K8R64_08085 [Methanosarcinaceae archaeon]|nr:hypothetical protein [Methanosarcinaceae archaeon]